MTCIWVSRYLFQLCIALSISLFPRSMAVAARNDACAPTAVPKANRHAIGARHAFDLLINSAPVPPAPLPCLDPTRRLSYPVGQASQRTINFDPPRSISTTTMMMVIPSIPYPHPPFVFPHSFSSILLSPLVSLSLQFFSTLHLASPHPDQRTRITREAGRPLPPCHSRKHPLIGLSSTSLLRLHTLTPLLYTHLFSIFRLSSFLATITSRLSTFCDYTNTLHSTSHTNAFNSNRRRSHRLDINRPCYHRRLKPVNTNALASLATIVQ